METKIALGALIILCTAITAKYISTRIGMLAYIYWTVEKNHTQPTKAELAECSKKVIRQMFN